MTDLAVIREAALRVLPDTPTHRNRMVIRSETSSREYTIAQRITTGLWECSCPGWKGHRKCKHLGSMGLPSVQPLVSRPRAIGGRPRTAAQRAASRLTFSDAAYTHYDTSGGFGSPDEWIKIAAAFASGRGRRVFRRDEPVFASPDLAVLGLDELPSDPIDLMKAMKRAAQAAHPDRGGTAADFIAVRDAYGRLIQEYPKKVRNEASWGKEA